MTFCYICDADGDRVEVERPAYEKEVLPVCVCRRLMRRDYQSEHKEVGFVDGESTGFYGKDTGFPLAGDPQHPTRRVCKSKKAWTEYVKRSEGKVLDVT